MSEFSPDSGELILSRAQVRALDQIAQDHYGLSGLVLMENAGRGCAELLLRQGVQGRVVICCGKGNNGGDGFVIARHLEIAGLEVRVLLLAAPHEIQGHAAANLRVLHAAGTPLELVQLPRDAVRYQQALSQSAWIVDALLGTGTAGEIREPYVTAIQQINGTGRPVLAVDLPSGLDCDTGQPLGPCIQARLTATFVARKPGFFNPVAAQWLGEVHVIGIGMPRVVLGDLAAPRS